jgi:tetratricopeptide (TPR) repeat protein
VTPTRSVPLLLILVALASGRIAAADPATERRGLALYQAGKYAEAAVELETAYIDAPTLPIGFALAQSLRLAGNCTRALIFYRQVLEQAPPASRAKLVAAMAPCEELEHSEAIRIEDGRVEAARVEAARVEAARGEAVRKASAEPSRDAAPETRPWHRDVLGGVLVGAGLLSAGAGGYAFVVARGRYADAEHATSDHDFRTADAAGQRSNRYGIIGSAVGGALVAGGIVRYIIVGLRARRSTSTAFVVDPASHGVIVSSAWSW